MTQDRLSSNAARYAIFAAFGGFVFGLDAANISGAIRFVNAQYGLDSMQTGALGSVPLIGVIIALLFTGWLCERFGRKKILVAIAFTYTLSSLLSAFALNFPMLLFGRFIGGVAFASLTVSAMYIGEIAPADRRGRYVSMAQLLIVLGSLLAFIVNYFLVKAMPESGWLHEQNIWRYMLGFELIANAIWIAMVLSLPQSPRWLIKKNREQEARPILAKLLPAQQVDGTVTEIQESLSKEPETSPLQQLSILFSKRMRFVVAIAVVYAVTQGATGMNAVLFFAPVVFEQVGMSTSDAFFQTIIFGVVSVLGTIIAISLVEKLGRRILTLAGLILIILSHTSIWYGFHTASYSLDQAAIETITDENVDISKLTPLIGKEYDDDVALKRDLAEIYTANELPLVTGPVIKASIDIKPLFVLIGIFAFVAAFNLSVGPIMWVIFSEIFPISVRSVAIPFAAFIQTISSFAITQFFPWLSENLGSANTFLVYAIVGVVGLIIMFVLLPETKGKSIEQLEDELIRS